MKLLGIDYGRRRIGCAVSDVSGRIVRSLPTIDLLRRPDALAQVVAVIQREQPDLVVIGLPLDHLDAETILSKEIRAFAARLLEKTRIDIRFVDESSTSAAATHLLRSRPKKQRRDKAAVDRIAACLILETYIRENEAASGGSR